MFLKKEILRSFIFLLPALQTKTIKLAEKFILQHLKLNNHSGNTLGKFVYSLNNIK